AYLLMSLSLTRDGDLLCEPQDTRRWFDEFPLAEHRNLILMSDDGWRTVYFGKPYLYPLFAAPAAALFGANGLVAFNMALLMGMVWLGASYLARFNPAPAAALFSAGFFLLSIGFAYVFWLQPELFNMASVAAALYLAFHEFRWAPPVTRVSRLVRRLLPPAIVPAASGAVLALGVYNKPVLAAFALPAVYAFWRRRGWRGVAGFVAGAALMTALVCGVAIAFTGHPSAYLGVARGGFSIQGPGQMPDETFMAVGSSRSPTQNDWSWIFTRGSGPLPGLPDTDWGQVGKDLGLFLWGRHTGLLLYTPFAALALMLFLFFERRSIARWLTLGALAAVALFFLIWIPFNWHGGGGFVGNRYFVNAYPAFLFLVTRIRPAWLTVLGYAAGGVFLAPIVFTPFGAPVVEPTLQAHVRNAPFQHFPLELSLHRKIPGYRGVVHSSVWFLGRKDVFRPRGEEIWLQGAGTVEVWMQSEKPLGEVLFEVRNQAPGNRVELELEGDRETLVFPDRIEGVGEVREVALTPSGPGLVRREKGTKVYAYQLLVRTRTGQIPALQRNGRPEGFYLGAALAFLGTRQQLDADLYRVAWSAVQLPDRLETGQPFEITLEVQNRSGETWPAGGLARVNLSYHWLDASGAVAVWDGRRTALPQDVPAGTRVRMTQKIQPPESPGRYTLVLDPVREKVTWFSEKNPETTYTASVEVLPAAPEESATPSLHEPR
ncbi:MAG: hypothetical protein V3T81_08890, partial [Thermoanaerobaculia bacterium]